ncbi:hypothetical protein G5V57_05300 [Nordella sp. HKS 07]|uniref:hypothetical protein n=1 Tax=Nordella sp. HKS 07 TaxID=2712222 RepID=UPI0013E116B6|nr:hypothetical protein [Nordella sp. HKS 07]QIG47200.1 hypothetical protein G5V57_05300 [Nordella sp. HKS 07]
MKKGDKRKVAKLKSDDQEDAALKRTVAYLRDHIDDIRPDPVNGRRGLRHAGVELFKEMHKVVGAEQAESAMLGWIYHALRGDEFSHDLIMGTAADHILSGRAVPETLRAYVVKTMLRPPNYRKLGRNRYTLAGRDVTIGMLVADLCRDYGINPTRNPLNEAVMSGCSILSKALAEIGSPMTEGAVEKVWNRMVRMMKETMARNLSDERAARS